ncbi:hypothetical protein [Mobilicoccus pelagius]|uniref:Uncharacterized protein n=1 Tax=Mobilicoccus pelagius NBRC 104925 TaxID=1089455 RepID=H5UND6_9MICO|nr:hypothetical protein [Mobilicoccus pelagius]GAB47244.1 hypothetical protein MOPEL_007_00600 [Mobilicoccus pelagius NBRC 104925]
MDVVLLSIAMVTVIGALLTAAVVIPARRRGATLVNKHTFTRSARRPSRRRRNNVFVARQKQPLDLTPLLSQGVAAAPRARRGSLTRAS